MDTAVLNLTHTLTTVHFSLIRSSVWSSPQYSTSKAMYSLMGGYPQPVLQKTV